MPITLEALGWAPSPDIKDAPPEVYHYLWLGPVPDGVELPKHCTHAESDLAVPMVPVNEVFIWNMIERLEIDMFLLVWRALFEACEHGAIIRIHGAAAGSSLVEADPTRLRGLSPQLFEPLSPKGREQIRSRWYDDDRNVRQYDGLHFELERLQPCVYEEWEGRGDDALDFGSRHYRDVVRTLLVQLRVVKRSETEES